MANIDLQSLISQLSTSNGTASGAKTGVQSATAGPLFGSILGQQQQGIAPNLLAGKNLPGGKLPASLDDTEIDQTGQKGINAASIAPGNVELAHRLAKLAQMPTESASLPMQELQIQLQQLMQGEPESETSLDDLTAMTSLMAGNDAAVSTPATTIASSLSTSVPMANSGFSIEDSALLDEPQLLQAAQQMGIDPAIANYILQATKAVQPPVADNVVTTATNPADTAKILGANQLPNEPISTGSASLQNVGATVQTTVPSPVAPQIAAQAQPQVSISVEPQIATKVQQSTSELVARANVNANPTANNPVASQAVRTQAAAQDITDDVVIRVRQAGAEAASSATATASNVAVSAQDFFRQRGVQTANNAALNPNQQPESAAGESLMRIPDALMQKLDMVGQPQPAPTASAAEALAAPVSGASFKSMAHNSLATGQVATGSIATAEVPVAEGGSRLLSLMQGDNPAQQAARNMQNQVGQQLQRMVRDGQWQANINLNPARLGQIKINMIMEDGILTTQLLSANQGVRELLEGGMPRLRELLEESGLQLGQVNVGSDGKQQQFADQDAQTGEVSQLQDSQTAATSNTNEGTSNHDGDLDTFA